MISVTVVRITPDLSIAKVYLSIYPLQHDKDLDPLAEVHENQSRLRHELGNRVRHQLRIIPELLFYVDDSFDYLENIERLLKICMQYDPIKGLGILTAPSLRILYNLLNCWLEMAY
jgi:ribosome-binding factor A